MMIRIGSYLEAKSINQSRSIYRTERRTADAKEQYCSEEVLLGVNFFQALVRECGVAWYGVTN